MNGALSSADDSELAEGWDATAFYMSVSRENAFLNFLLDKNGQDKLQINVDHPQDSTFFFRTDVDTGKAHQETIPAKCIVKSPEPFRLKIEEADE